MALLIVLLKISLVNTPNFIYDFEIIVAALRPDSYKRAYSPNLSPFFSK